MNHTFMAKKKGFTGGNRVSGSGGQDDLLSDERFSNLFEG
jgi:hypothetical protein